MAVLELHEMVAENRGLIEHFASEATVRGITTDVTNKRWINPPSLISASTSTTIATLDNISGLPWPLEKPRSSSAELNMKENMAPQGNALE